MTATSMSDKKSKIVYELLDKVNDSLLHIEELMEEAVDIREHYVNVFVLGVPRSGTTLATQLIFSNMDIKCTNNLMARFWKVPLVGCLISREVIGNVKESEYTSTYGTTHFPWEPHEFSWFWHDLLGIDIKKGFRYPCPNEIDWSRIKAKICTISNFMKSSMVHKPLELVGYYLDNFVRLFKRSIFVYVERDDLDVAYSIAQARINTNGLSKWWGSYLPADKMSLLNDKPYNVQIAGQVFFLKKMYSKNLVHVPQERLIKVTYQTLCNNPQKLLSEIDYKSKALGCKISITNEPKLQSCPRKSRDKEIVKDLLSGFDIVRGMYNE